MSRTEGKLIMTYEEFLEHDCHLSPEDACTVCYAWIAQKNRERYIVDEALLKLFINARKNL